MSTTQEPTEHQFLLDLLKHLVKPGLYFLSIPNGWPCMWNCQRFCTWFFFGVHQLSFINTHSVLLCLMKSMCILTMKQVPNPMLGILMLILFCAITNGGILPISDCKRKILCTLRSLILNRAGTPIFCYDYLSRYLCTSGPSEPGGWQGGDWQKQNQNLLLQKSLEY